ncbi:MAG: hypothetical protein AB4911_24490 [Oscillochloridaceae bacterium umkhey_bin13]
MLKRVFISLVLGFMLGTSLLVLIPQLGVLAAPFVCAGSLEPETRLQGMRYRCVEAADGRIRQVPADQVLSYTIPILALLLFYPVSLAVKQAELRAQQARSAMRQDLEVAITARAEILRIVRQSSVSRQMLMRAAELRIVLWVQPPNGRPYEAKVAWLVEDAKLQRLAVGAVVPVRINPRRPEAVYPDQPWAHYAWWS